MEKGGLGWRREGLRWRERGFRMERIRAKIFRSLL